MNKKIDSLKNHVAKNREHLVGLAIAGGVAIATMGAMVIAVQHNALMEHNEFLKENDLFDKYYETDLDEI